MPATTSAVHPIVDGRLYAVGGTYPLDGRVTWAPVAPGYHPTNAYILKDGDDVLIIDPGLKAFQREFLEGVEALVSTDAEVRILITRPQFDCVGNVGPLFDMFPKALLCTTLSPNYFDAFDDLLAVTENGKARMTILRTPNASGLEVMNPVLHLIRTIWAYDPGTRTLFSSDAFSHGTLQSSDERPIIDSAFEDKTTVEDVVAHLTATHHWMLPHAPLRAIADDIVATFDRFDVRIIAPDRGSILVGKDVVDHHVQLMVDALVSLGRSGL